MSSEVEPTALVSGEAKPTLRGWVRRSPPPKAGKGRASPQRSGEAEPMATVLGDGEPTPRDWVRLSLRTWGLVGAVVMLLTAQMNQC